MKTLSCSALIIIRPFGCQGGAPQGTSRTMTIPRIGTRRLSISRDEDNKKRSSKEERAHEKRNRMREHPALLYHRKGQKRWSLEFITT